MSDAEIAVDSVDSTEPVGAEEAVSEPVGVTEGTDAGVAEETFFEFEHPETREKLQFRNKGELADHLRHSSMFKSDYDKRMSQVSERAKYLEEQIKKYDAIEQQVAQSDYTKFARWAEANPRKFQQLQEAWQKDTSPQKDPVQDAVKVFEEKYGKRFQELDEADRRRAEEEERRQAVSALKDRYPDLDETIFDKELGRLESVPEQDRRRAFLELLYHANLGRNGAAAVERKLAQSPNAKPSVTSTSGAKGKGVDVSGKSMTEIREMAEAELAKMGLPE